jgi:hypothetical protein
MDQPQGVRSLNNENVGLICHQGENSHKDHKNPKQKNSGNKPLFQSNVVNLQGEK